MKRISVLQAQSVKAVNISPTGWFGYLPDAVDAFTKEYKFVKSPTTASEIIPIDAEKPIVFREGKLDLKDRSIIISELQVFRAGLIAFVRTNTTEGDIVTEHIMEWAKSHFKLTFEPIRPIGHYSQLEVQFEGPFAELLKPLSDIGEAITKGLDDFWKPRPNYELVGLNFGYDPFATPKFAPSIFKIERRVEIPFDSHLYFSEAAMTTDNHVAVLEKFERICLERFSK
jgi:hypothetical protein